MDYFARLPRGSLAIALGCLGVTAIMWALILERVRFEESTTVENAVQHNTNLAIAYEEHTLSTLGAVAQKLELVMREYRRQGLRLDLRQLASGGVPPGIFHHIGILDRRGETVLASTDFQPLNAAGREYFQYHRQHAGGELLISKPVLGFVSRKMTIHISRRIDNPDGSFGGVALAAVDPAYFTNFYQKTDLGEHGLVALVGRDGFVRARRSGGRSTFGQDMLASALFAEHAKRSAGNYLSGGRREGVPRYISYRSLVHYPLIVAVGRSQPEVLAEVRDREHKYYWGASLASALLALLAAGFMTALVRQKRASDALVRSEARFRVTFDQAAVGITHVALDGRHLRVNQKFCRMLDYTEAELLSLTVDDIAPPADRIVTGRLRKSLLGDESDSVSPVVEKRIIRKDGSVLWVSLTVGLVRDAAGNPEYFVTMIHDISARKEAEERYRVTFNQAAAGIGHTGVDGRFIETNARLAEILGYTQAELLARSIRDILAPEDLPLAYEERRKFEAHERESSLREFRHVRKDGSRGWALCAMSPVRDPSGTINYYVTVVHDISERKQAEQALIESKRQLRQAMEQRERLSRDLHDGIVQSIYAIGLGLEEAGQLVAEDSQKAAKSLSEAIARLNEVIREIRNHIVELEPKTWDWKHLRRDLEGLLTTVKAAHRLGFRLEAEPNALSTMSPQAAHEVLNIVREAVSNSLRHSGAKRGMVSLTRINGAIRLEIADDGAGFDLLGRRGDGQGLRNIAARAQALSAQLDICSSPGRGTRVVVDIPQEPAHAGG